MLLSYCASANNFIKELLPIFQEKHKKDLLLFRF